MDITIKTEVIIISRRARKIWSEEDLDLAFSVLPTKENAKKLGKVMDRTPDSVELTWKFSINTKKRNEAIGQRGVWAERCRKARIRNGWVL